MPAPLPAIDVPPIALTQHASLWNTLPSSIASARVKTMEEVGQSYGYIDYRTTITAVAKGERLKGADETLLQTLLQDLLSGRPLTATARAQFARVARHGGAQRTLEALASLALRGTPDVNSQVSLNIADVLEALPIRPKQLQLDAIIQTIQDVPGAPSPSAAACCGATASGTSRAAATPTCCGAPTQRPTPTAPDGR